jgi:hypothetical protein
MNPTISESATSTDHPHRLSRSHILHIVFICLTPLLWLALIVGAILLLTSLIRYMTAPAGFFVEQQINVIAVSAGLVLSAIVYTLGNVRALRTIRKWEREDKKVLATGGLWGLGITAFTAIALPILLIFFIH